MNKIEKDLMNIILNKSACNLDQFINKKLKSKIFKNKKRHELLRLLPIIISNTNETNSDWLNSSKNLKWFKMPGFLDNIIENIDNFNFNNKNDYLLYKVIRNIGILDLTEEQLVRLSDKILDCDVNIRYMTLYAIYDLLNRNNNDILTKQVLEKYLLNNSTCNTTINLIISNNTTENNSIDLLYKNIDSILEKNNSVDLVYLKNVIDNEQTITKIKEKIQKDSKTSLMTSFNNKLKCFINRNKLDEESNKKLDTILEIIYLIAEDIAKNEQIALKETKYLGQGSFSLIYCIGNKVIKLGTSRGADRFPNNPYIIKPLLRKKFTLNATKDFYIEVTERVDTKTKIPEEKLYELYKKIRNSDLIWSDVEYRNVGILLKDNIIHWRQELPITDEVLGLDKYIEGEELKKGELVICDNDHIFYDNSANKNISNPISQLQQAFESRYQEEKNKKFIKKLSINNFNKIIKFLIALSFMINNYIVYYYYI